MVKTFESTGASKSVLVVRCLLLGSETNPEIFVGICILVNKSWAQMHTTREVSSKGCFTKAWKR